MGDGRVTWAERGERVQVLGHAVFVVDRAPVDGDAGPPVLVLHGFPTSSHDWHRVVDRFAGRRRVVLPDLLGFGLSDKPDQRYSLFEQADLVAALIGDLGLDEVALIPDARSARRVRRRARPRAGVSTASRARYFFSYSASAASKSMTTP